MSTKGPVAQACYTAQQRGSAINMGAQVHRQAV